MGTFSAKGTAPVFRRRAGVENPRIPFSIWIFSVSRPAPAAPGVHGQSEERKA